MFNIDIKNISKSETPVIVSGYNVIHFDDVPILYTGHDKYGVRVIGSMCCESEDMETLRYLHITVSEKDYADFKSRVVTLLQLMTKNHKVWVIDKDVNQNIVNIYFLKLSAIPSDYLPLKQSFFPKKTLN